MNFSSANGNVFQNNLAKWNHNITDSELASIALFQNYPDGLLNFAAICCMVLMSIGIPGNLVTIFALSRYKKVRNATSILIVNLSCSDLLFCCFNLPMTVSTLFYRSWTHGRLFCRIFAYARYGLGGVCLNTILMITINRYIIISHPNLYSKLYSRRYLTLMLLLTWTIPFGIMILTWFGIWGRFGLNVRFGTCDILPDVNGRSPKTFLWPMWISLPLFAIIICYARIFYIVKRATNASGANMIRKSINLGQTDSCPSTEIQTNSDQRTAKPKKINEMYTISINCEEKNDTKETNDESKLWFNIKKPVTKVRKTVRGKPMALVRNSLSTRKDIKLRTMIIAIMISFSLTHLPVTVPKMFKNYTCHPIPNTVGFIFLCISPCINPVIYVVMSSEYRQAYKNLFQYRR